MARLARLSIPNELHHVVQLGHNREPVFKDDEDRTLYLATLRDQAHEHGVRVHGYTLLDSSVELLITPADPQALARLMQGLGRRYVAAFNRRHGRSGTLWAGRYRASLLEAERYLVPALVYLGWRAVEQGLATEAHLWPWASVGHHLGAKRDPLVNDHAEYWRLGNTPFDRELAFRLALDGGLSASEASTIRLAAIGSRPLGGASFLSRLGEVTNRPLVRRPRGRPRKLSVPI